MIPQIAQPSLNEEKLGDISGCVWNLEYLQCWPVQVRLDGVDSILFDPKLVNLCTVVRMEPLRRSD